MEAETPSRCSRTPQPIPVAAQYRHQGQRNLPVAAVHNASVAGEAILFLQQAESAIVQGIVMP